MKFLVDNQLPPALATHLALQDVVSQHVSAVGLDQASDRDIWTYAATNGFIIVSKDEDFLHLSIADPGGPPVVWVRLGNCRKGTLLAAVDRCWPSLMSALQTGSKIVEVR